ncbi:MAG: alpha/beta hydrolase [Selenomonadaceae bacterium]|nr:alpha/beta hydrolase [Selenomonadaceae bacterium]
MFESKILNVTIRKPKIHFIPDVVYAQVPTFEKPNQLLQMDLLIPQIEKKLPTVIFVTGGGFISSNRARMPQLRMYLAERNFVVASINYRTAPNSKFPQPVEDVKSAIRFLKVNAFRFNVDTEKIFVIGDSAGGFLTAFVAVTNEEKILAAVDLYGVLDLKAIAKIFPLEGFFDATEEVDPIKYVTKNSAPMLLMHGTADNIVSPAQTDLLFQALKSHGVKAERYLIPNANHADEYWQQPEVLNVIAEFLEAHL